MFLIVATYGLRAILVMTLYSGMPSYYKKALLPISGTYISWIITTRWMPSVFCSLCLVNEMKRHGPNSTSSNTSGTHTQAKADDSSIGEDGCLLDPMGDKLLHTDAHDQLNPLLPPVSDYNDSLYHHPSRSISSFSSIYLDTSSILADTSFMDNINSLSPHPYSSDDSNSVFRLSTSTAAEGMDYFFSTKALHNIRVVSEC